MKRVYSIIICLLISYSSKAQFEHLSIPNFIKATNAHPAVIISIVNMPLPGSSRSVDKYESGSYKRLTNSSLYDPSPVVFDFITQFIKEDLTSLGITPSLFINASKERFEANTEVEMENNIRRKLFDAKSKYYIHISVNRYPSEKAIEKGRANRDNLLAVGAGIGLSDGNVLLVSAEDILYMTIPSNVKDTYTDFINQLKTAIKAKPASYFIKTMPERDNNIAFRPLIEDQKFPDDLKQSEVLIVKAVGSFSDFINKSIIKEMANYPFKYRLVDFVELHNLPKDKYPYFLDGRAVPYELKTVSRLGNNNDPGTMGMSKSNTSIQVEIYYTLKNRQTLDVYYGDNIETVMINGADRMPSKGIAYWVKNVRKQFNFPIKK